MPRNANQSKFSNYSMDFDGSQHIDIGSDISVSGNCTVSFWFKSPAIPDTSSQAIFARFTGLSDTDFLIIGLYLQGVLASNDSNLASSKTTKANITLVTDTWYHCVVTKVSGVVNKIYIDGTDRTGPATNPGESWSSQASNSGFIGQRGYGGKFIGQIDALAIFDYALSQSQVTTLWGGGTSVSNPMALPSPPIAYYPLGTSAYNGEYLAENNAIEDYVFDFDGSSSKVRIADKGNIFSEITKFTFSGWFKIDSYASASQNLLDIADGNTRYFSSNFFYASNQIRFNVLPGVAYISNLQNIVPEGTWFHYAGVFDGDGASNTDKAKLYINGDLVTLTFAADFPSGFLTIPSTADIDIGGSLSPFSGLVGEASNLQFWNINLSLTEVETLYNYGSPIKTLANIPQSSNLKAWYKLDASEVYNNTTTEWSVDNNQNPSAYPSSLNFNGSSNYIDCGTGSRFYINQITISAWVNLSSGLTSTQIIAGIRNTTVGGSSICYQLQNQASGKFRFVIRQSNGTYVDSVANDVHQYNTWYHVLGVADGSNIKLYVNGNLQTIVSSYDGTIYSPNENFNIGRQSSPSNYYFDGKLSNVSVFNTGLTSAQVTELYNNGTPSNLSSHSVTSNLISWWKLNNTTTGIEDAKGSNNGTNNGATEYIGFVNTLVGESSGMSQANLVQSDLQTVAPYSKYAMDFDGSSSDAITLGNTIGNGFTQITCSAWVNLSTTELANNSIYRNFLVKFNGTALGPFELRGNYARGDSGNNKLFFRVATDTGSYGFTDTGFAFTEANRWYHIVGTYDGSNVKTFVDGVEKSSISANGTLVSNSDNATIGFDTGTGGFDGKISNPSIWNVALTSAQVTELYNEGLPGNLNSHSAYSNLVSWWQLGENSSFDGNDWIVADEKGTNNGTSIGMPVGALTNGVGTTANGVSSGMSEGNLVGDAPYSTANAISTNMVVTSRVTGSGNTP